MSPHRWAIVGAALLIGSASGAARAEDPKSTSLTVLPSTGASLVFAAKDEKYGALSYSYLGRSGFRVSVSASAPLDNDTRVAAFLRQNELVGGFSFNVQIGYDSAFDALKLTEAEVSHKLNELCEDIKAVEAGYKCGDYKEVDGWLTQHPDSPLWQKYPFLRAKRQARREAPLRVIPPYREGRMPYSSIGADLAASFDRASVYKDDLATDPMDVSKYKIQVGVQQITYFAGQLALTLRGGLDVSKGFSTVTVKRCIDVPSTTSSITGSACNDKALFLKRLDESASAAGYGRLALTYVPLTTYGGTIPGVELRAGFEQLGQKPKFNIRAIGFVTPPLGLFAARFGIGLDLNDALADDPDAGLTRGQLVFTPFVLVGITPTMLEGFSAL